MSFFILIVHYIHLVRYKIVVLLVPSHVHIHLLKKQTGKDHTVNIL